MIPWLLLGRARAPGGGELSLHQRDREFAIRIDGAPLMGSREHGSEDALAQLACEGLADRKDVRVLVGGLGMGFTLRATLDALGRDARVDVAELVPIVVEWNRGPLAPLADAPLSDPRTTVLIEDVAKVIAAAPARYDAIMLDVDNGPDALTSPANARLYGARGLASARAALKPGGVLAVWSANDDGPFTAAFQRAGYAVRVERVLARHNGNKPRGKKHVVWLGRTPVRR